MGPYHPALPQPLRLTFKLRGERIVGVETPVAGFCRRGVESLAIGQDDDHALKIVERACGWSGHSYRTALAQALEAAAGTPPSPRVQIVRTVFAEVERILARLWLLAQVARAGSLQPLLRDALEARERFYDALTETTGERHYWGVAVVGGVRTLDAPDLQPLSSALEQFGATVDTWKIVTGPRGALGRLGADLGHISEQQVREQRVSSVVARAAGVADDLRRDTPYGGYALASVDWPDDSGVERKGDVAARCAVAADDLATSVRVAGALLRALPDASDSPGAGTRAAAAPAKSGRARVEAPHGAVEVTVSATDSGRIADFRLDTPGAGTLSLLPAVLEGQPVSASALIIASLDMCIECLDR
jgi:Ni,Fe-hydrogenase III large subunit